MANKGNGRHKAKGKANGKTKTKAKGKGKGKGGKPSGTVVGPGVLVEEGSAARPIEGVGTAVASFVGLDEGASGVMRRTGAVLLVVGGAAAGVLAWRYRDTWLPESMR